MQKVFETEIKVEAWNIRVDIKIECSSERYPNQHAVFSIGKGARYSRIALIRKTGDSIKKTTSKILR